jgi:hypothetical protein
MNSIFPFFQWVGRTWLAKLVSDSTWMFPAIEAVHIVALALLFGAVIVLNLRLMGVVMQGRSLPQLAREMEPFTVTSLVIILITGGMLFASEAVKSFHSTPFRVKMVLLFVAIIFHFAVSKRFIYKEDELRTPLLSKAVAVAGITLWISVGFAGRAIGFF